MADIILPLVNAAVGFGASFIGGQKRLQAQEEAQEDFEAALSAFSAQEITNPFEELQNPFEDLTVNTQAAEFAAQRQRQGLADVLDATRTAAGGSGIAALAQSLANVQAENIQKASADIGRQEAANQRLAAQGQARIQQLEAAGEVDTQKRQSDLLATELGISQMNLAQANFAIQEAQRMRMQALGMGAGALAGGVGNIMEDTNFFTGKER
jgi:hypothetical protein